MDDLSTKFNIPVIMAKTKLSYLWDTASFSRCDQNYQHTNPPSSPDSIKEAIFLFEHENYQKIDFKRIVLCIFKLRPKTIMSSDQLALFLIGAIMWMWVLYTKPITAPVECLAPTKGDKQST